MSEEAAFLRAIQANPADTTAKLVYADWLDEHGEPERAEYLRLDAKRQQTKKLSELERIRFHGLEQAHPVWVELVRCAHIWDELTMFALGRLCGLLDTYAILNGHDSDIAYYFDASLIPLTGTIAEVVNRGTGNHQARFEPQHLPDWEDALRDILREWLFHQLRHLTAPAHTRLAIQTDRGREGCIADALVYIRAVVNPTGGWRLRRTGGERGGIDWADIALEAPDRVLQLHFSFDD